MDSSLVLPLITGSGVAGIFCVLFVIGLIYPRQVVADLKTEIAELKGIVVAERARADSAITAASTSRDVLSAIQLGRELGTARDTT